VLVLGLDNHSMLVLGLDIPTVEELDDDTVLELAADMALDEGTGLRTMVLDMDMARDMALDEGTGLGTLLRELYQTVMLCSMWLIGFYQFRGGGISFLGTQ
jgi:hypothetical protein